MTNTGIHTYIFAKHEKLCQQVRLPAESQSGVISIPHVDKFYFTFFAKVCF